MKELLRYNMESGATSFSYDVKEQPNGIAVIFVQTEYSDNNRWRKPNVAVDMFIKKCFFDKYSDFNYDAEMARSIIEHSFDDTLQGVRDLEALASEVSEIVISMPTNLYTPLGNPRAYSNTFRPLIVKIDENDVSSAFQDFDLFEEKAVEKAYEVLIDGNIPEVKNDLFDKKLLQDLHNKVFNKDTENEA